jgi:gliding motility-associated-like protein
MKLKLTFPLSLLLIYFSTISGQTTMPDIVCPGQTKAYYVNYNPGSTYIWRINGIVQRGHNSNEFTHTWEPADTFLLEVQEISFTGCIGSVSSGKVIVREVIVSDLFLIIPEAFSPNGDMINDYWEIKNIEIYPRAEITVYNRWGQVVWRSERGYSQQWDGKNKNGIDMPTDSYHYVIDRHNSLKLLIGTVTIIK